LLAYLRVKYGVNSFMACLRYSPARSSFSGLHRVTIYSPGRPIFFCLPINPTRSTITTMKLTLVSHESMMAPCHNSAVKYPKSADAPAGCCTIIRSYGPAGYVEYYTLGHTVMCPAPLATTASRSTIYLSLNNLWLDSTTSPLARTPVVGRRDSQLRRDGIL
jgi:hypothetical protein